MRWGLLFSSIFFCEFRIWGFAKGMVNREIERGGKKRIKTKKRGVFSVVFTVFLSFLFPRGVVYCVPSNSKKTDLLSSCFQIYGWTDGR